MLSQTFAIRGRYAVDPNRELVALGAANIAGGFFQGFPVSRSSSRTPVAESAGAKTQVAGLMGAAAIALIAVWSDLPCAVDPLAAPHSDSSAPGTAVVPSCRATAPSPTKPLGRVDHLEGYHDVERFPRARIAASDPAVRWVIVAAEPITDVDVTAGEMLEGFLGELRDAGIELGFAEMTDPVKDRLRRYGSFERIGADRFYPTMGVAVDAYLDATGAPWVDREDATAEASETAAGPSEEPG